MTGSTTSSSLSDPSSHAMSAVRPVTVLVSDASRNERSVSPIVKLVAGGDPSDDRTMAAAL